MIIRPKVCSDSFSVLPGASTFTCTNTKGDQLGQKCAVIVSCLCTSTFTFTNTKGDQLGLRCAAIVSWIYLEHLPDQWSIRPKVYSNSFLHIYLYMYKHNRWSIRPKVCSDSFLFSHIYLYLYKHKGWSVRPKVRNDSFSVLPGASTFTCANTIGDQLGQMYAAIVSWFYLVHLPLPVQTQ